ncbi:MAG: DivIVA domain-containing protein [candidate division WOR-3 bacterium]
MALTPLEIRKKAFALVLRGYSPKEVRAFLAAVANEFEELRKERAQLAEKVDELGTRLAGYEKTEGILKETLLTAQKTIEELRTAAQKECEALIQSAKQEAERLKNDMVELRQRRALILDEIRGIANTYLAIVERFERESKPQSQNDAAKTEDSGKRPGDKK